MGVRPPQPLASPRPGPCPGPRQLLLLLLGLTASLTTALGVGCNPEECMLLYDAELQERGLAGPEASTAFCAVLYEFGLCTYSMRRACRGDLQYHSANSMLVHLKTTFECNRRFTTSAPPAGRSTPTTTTSAAPPPAPVEREGQPPPAECSQRKPFKAFKHCGLFGDPHLKTFGGSMQTCRVQGAWPLVDNPFLAVQVTNDHVLEGSPVTATTKVTVLVKGSTTSGPCTAPKTKTYEATAEAPLPHTFIDGTNKSGPGEAVTIRYQETAYGASVEIHIQYIETTIIVRKMGRYLAFSTRMPEELVSWGDDQAEGVDGEGHSPQLCVQGCPQSERLSLSLHRGSVLSWTDALDKCAAKSPLAAGGPTAGTGAYSNEVHGDLTDQYLEWCVFDLMTTGQDDFVLAARSALYDALAMDPGHQRNGTGDTFNAVAPAASTTGAAASSASPSFSLLLLLLLLCGRRVAR